MCTKHTNVNFHAGNIDSQCGKGDFDGRDEGSYLRQEEIHVADVGFRSVNRDLCVAMVI